jgi:hypothetical protein
MQVRKIMDKEKEFQLKELRDKLKLCVSKVQDFEKMGVDKITESQFLEFMVLRKKVTKINMQIFELLADMEEEGGVL